MRNSFRSVFTRAGSVLLACLGAAGCANSSGRWVLIEPHAPSRQATALGINADGAIWFFQCDEKAIMSGLHVSVPPASEGAEKVLSITFDAEPAEQSSWRVERSTYVMRGEGATALARRAALAYDAVVDVDGAQTEFSLTGSHVAMIEMTRTCPFLEVE